MNGCLETSSRFFFYIVASSYLWHVLKRLLYVTSRFPFPLDKGDKLRAYQQIKFLSEFFEIHLFSISETHVKSQDFEELKKYCKEIEIVKLNKAMIFFQLLKNVFSSLPFQVAYFNSGKIRRAFSNYSSAQKFDVAYFQLVRTAELSGLNSKQTPKVLDLMDAMSMNMQLRSRREYFPLNFIFKNEALRLKSYEKRIASNFDRIIAISQRDLKLMQPDANENAYVISNGIDTHFYRPSDLNARPIDLLFVGAMSYVPNEEAVLYIYHKLIPMLSERGLRPQVAIVGHSPGRKLRQLHSGSFQITGRVADTREYYASAKIFVAPMFYGTGQQNKILEAMAMGVPVVTTSHANDAIGARPGVEIMIANSAEQFVEIMSNLMIDEDLRQQLASNARKFVETNFESKVSGNQLVLCLNELMKV